MSAIQGSASTGSEQSPKQRIRVFVDYWNLQLTINERNGGQWFDLDWKILGTVLAEEACATIGVRALSFDGVIVYSSYDHKTPNGLKHHRWMTTWLNRQPGVTVICLQRKPKNRPKCPSCYGVIHDCPHCGQPINATVEKGVDTHIATDMIRLAWEEAYDLAVLATSDGDLIPAVQFLNQKGMKVVQAGFPPGGAALATQCWASFDIWSIKDQIRRSRNTEG